MGRWWSSQHGWKGAHVMSICRALSQHGSCAPVGIMRAEFGEDLAHEMAGSMACPMRGRRAPELACGALMAELDDFRGGILDQVGSCMSLEIIP